jgi:hypothetical protein
LYSVNKPQKKYVLIYTHIRIVLHVLYVYKNRSLILREEHIADVSEHRVCGNVFRDKVEEITGELKEK